jgi:hypothetical protein
MKKYLNYEKSLVPVIDINSIIQRDSELYNSCLLAQKEDLSHSSVNNRIESKLEI